MRTIALVVHVAFALAMLTACVWGAANLPGSARIPVHLGIRGFGTFLSKRVALMLWAVAAIGIVVPNVATMSAVEHDLLAQDVVLAVLPLLFVVQLLAFRKASSSTTNRRS